MEVLEPGQDWKIAALRSSFHVHFLFGGNMKKEYFDKVFQYAKKESHCPYWRWYEC